MAQSNNNFPKIIIENAYSCQLIQTPPQKPICPVGIRLKSVIKDSNQGDGKNMCHELWSLCVCVSICRHYGGGNSREDYPMVAASSSDRQLQSPDLTSPSSLTSDNSTASAHLTHGTIGMGREGGGSSISFPSPILVFRSSRIGRSPSITSQPPPVYPHRLHHTHPAPIHSPHHQNTASQ